MTHNAHIPSIYVSSIKDESPKFTLSRKYPIWNDLCWKLSQCLPPIFSITYTVITTIEMQTLIIGVMISKSLQEVLQSDLY